jgi:hypothetical protein
MSHDIAQVLVGNSALVIPAICGSTVLSLAIMIGVKRLAIRFMRGVDGVNMVALRLAMRVTETAGTSMWRVSATP